MGVVSLLAVLSGSGSAQELPQLSPAERAQLVMLTDGKGHYVGVLPLKADARKLIFYSSDGKLFYEQSLTSTGGEVDKRWSYLFVDPRFESMGVFQSELDFADGKYSLTCGERKVPLQPVPAAEAKAKLDAATLAPSPRKWRPYALARDPKAKYYYIDHGRTKATEKDFRLFVGPKGALVEQKMTNVVSDSEGDIFSTRSGSLRMLLSKKETFWVVKNKPNKLTLVPVEDNIAMIYNDLGIYVGQKMGTPCDDL